MTEQEAKMVCRIMVTADSGCDNCVRDLHEWFGMRYPEHQAVANEAYLTFRHVELGPHKMSVMDAGLDFTAIDQEDLDLASKARQRDWVEIMGMKVGPGADA